MKILLISDTHNFKNLLKDTILPQHANEIEMAIHLGDYVRDLLCLRSTYPTITMHGVDGAYENTEGVEHIITVGDKRILIVHGHTVHVKSGLDFIINYACKKEVDACFFGHTHEAVAFTEQGIFFMNPGSLTCPRSGSGSGSCASTPASTSTWRRGDTRWTSRTGGAWLRNWCPSGSRTARWSAG